MAIFPWSLFFWPVWPFNGGILTCHIHTGGRGCAETSMGPQKCCHRSVRAPVEEYTSFPFSWLIRSNRIYLWFFNFFLFYSFLMKFNGENKPQICADDVFTRGFNNSQRKISQRTVLKSTHTKNWKCECSPRWASSSMWGTVRWLQWDDTVF